MRQGTDTTTSTKEASSSPSALLTPPTTETHSPDSNLTFGSMASESPVQILSDLPGTASLEPDVQFLLAYRKQHINYRHYLLKSAAERFINEDMVRLAMDYEPLLYAMVGFVAYHYTLAQPDGKMYTFLQYYNKSVSLLLKSLQAGDRQSDAMLLTTLQLIVFEVSCEFSLICVLRVWAMLICDVGICGRLGESDRSPSGCASHDSATIRPGRHV